MSQGAGVGGWVSPPDAPGGTGALPTREQLEDLLAASFVSPLSTLDIAYDDASNAFEFDVDLAHPFVWSAQHDFLGDGGAVDSTGGSVNVTTTGHTGGGIHVYSNRGADAAGRLVTLWSDNAANPRNVLRARQDGTATAVSIEVQNTLGGSALDVVSNSLGTTVLGVQGDNNTQAVVKLTHQHGAGQAANSDAASAILRLNIEENSATPGSAAQGIYMYSEDGTVTTGDLIEIYNGASAAGNLRLLLEPAGRLVIPSAPTGTDAEFFRVGPTAFGINAATSVFFGVPGTVVSDRRTASFSRTWDNATPPPSGYVPGVGITFHQDRVIAGSPFDGVHAALAVTGYVGQTNAPNASFNAFGTRTEIHSLGSASNETSYLHGVVVDHTAPGQPHSRAWGQDTAVFGYGGNEQQEMLHNITAFINNHYDGFPSVAMSGALVAATGKGSGTGAEHSTVDTYPVYSGLMVAGRSTNASGAPQYGFIYGVRVGAVDSPWTAVTRVQIGASLWDWDQYGLEIGDRSTVAPTTNPFGIWINPLLGISVGGLVATRRQTITLANGVNNDIAVTQSFVRVQGPTAGFSITSIAPSAYTAPQDGHRVTIVNTTAQAMTITNAAGTGTAANRILTATGANRVGTAGNPSVFECVYDAASSRWRETSWEN